MESFAVETAVPTDLGDSVFQAEATDTPAQDRDHAPARGVTFRLDGLDQHDRQGIPAEAFLILFLVMGSYIFAAISLFG